MYRVDKGRVGTLDGCFPPHVMPIMLAPEWTL